MKDSADGFTNDNEREAPTSCFIRLPGRGGLGNLKFSIALAANEHGVRFIMKDCYCIYTDRYYDKEKMNSEHIIPLSLGGANGFEILVNSDVNAKLGSSIEGKLANDFFLKLKRTKLDIRGHSNKKASFVCKNAQLESYENNLRLEITRENGIKLWDPIAKSKVGFKNTLSFKNHIEFDQFRINRIRFAAKVALSAGYFIYGEKFTKNVRHDELRIIMNFNGDFDSEKVRNLSTTVDHQFGDDSNEIINAFKFVSSIVGENSCVGLIPINNTIAIFVGILGDYIGMLNVPCNTHVLLGVDKLEWGAFICIQDGKPIISSWRRMVERIGNILKSNLSL